jgi:hypothetical protein
MVFDPRMWFPLRTDLIAGAPTDRDVRMPRNQNQGVNPMKVTVYKTEKIATEIDVEFPVYARESSDTYIAFYRLEKSGWMTTVTKNIGHHTERFDGPGWKYKKQMGNVAHHLACFYAEHGLAPSISTEAEFLKAFDEMIAALVASRGKTGMNRRSFFSFLAGAPLAVAAGKVAMTQQFAAPMELVAGESLMLLPDGSGPATFAQMQEWRDMVEHHLRLSDRNIYGSAVTG